MVGLEKRPLLKRLAADGAAMLEFCRFRPLRGMSCWPVRLFSSAVGGLRSGFNWDGCEKRVCALGSGLVEKRLLGSLVSVGVWNSLNSRKSSAELNKIWFWIPSSLGLGWSKMLSSRISKSSAVAKESIKVSCSSSLAVWLFGLASSLKLLKGEFFQLGCFLEFWLVEYFPKEDSSERL